MYIFFLLEVTILPNFKKEVTEHMLTTWRQAALDQPIFLLPNIIFKNGLEEPRPIKILPKANSKVDEKGLALCFSDIGFKEY